MQPSNCLQAHLNLQSDFWRTAAPGSGKSSLLKALGNREIPIPEHIDTYFLDREAPASNQTALEVDPYSLIPNTFEEADPSSPLRYYAFSPVSACVQCLTC